MRVLYCTDNVPAIDRFDFYREAAAHSDAPIEIRGDRLEDLRIRMETMDLGPIAVAAMFATDTARFGIHRTPELIRRSDPEAYRVLIVLSGQMCLAQDERKALLGPRTLSLYDTSHPFDGWRKSTSGSNDLAMLTFPRALLPLPPTVVRSLIGVPLSGRHGLGALFVDFVSQLIAGNRQYTTGDTDRLSTVVMDLLVALLAHELDDRAGTAATPDSHRRVLLARVMAFIRERLGDPGLTPALIAAAHFVSTRSLHQLFHDEQLTVAGWIRTCRLERCRTDLADPVLASRPIHLIAARWGFGDSAHFSRVFRSTFGVTPTGWRRDAQLEHRTARTVKLPARIDNALTANPSEHPG